LFKFISRKYTNLDELKDKVVLITGGTGSFGYAFTKYLLDNTQVSKVRIFSRDELKQSEMRSYFNNDSRLRFLVGDVRDHFRVSRAVEGADYVVHAAAMKRVEVVEYNPFEAVQTNIIGTQNVINAAIDNNVEKVLALSTDKASAPSTLYGATKFCLEKIVTQGNHYSADKGTRLSCVRYGNVVGSRGSIVPLFTKMASSGKITITDPRMTRFWITLPQAVDFVVSSLLSMHGGEVFIPKLPSMRITDLARAIAPKCKLEYIGIRASEKLHESMISPDESNTAVDLGDRYALLSEFTKTQNYYKNYDLMDYGFEYSSSNNQEWLDEVGLLSLINESQTMQMVTNE
jgi:UDP-N-acetylglucosamine 4,6-dehydratase